MKRKLIPILVILLAIAIAAWWFDLPARLGSGDDRAGELTLYGNVDIRQVQLGFRVGGRIAEMAVDEGDAVAEGTRLASLDSRPYEDAVSEAEAQRASQAAQLAKLQAGPRTAEIAQARAQLAEREADLRNAQQALTRSQELRPRGAVSQANLDQAQAAKDMAVARVSSAREALQLLEEGSRPEDVAAAQANLHGAEARLAAARTALADTVLNAPSAGTVLSRVREPGAIVASGETVFVLSLDRPVWVRAYIPEPDLGRIHPGMTVDVATDTAGKHYVGRIGFISPVAEFTPKSVETTELRTELVYRLRIVVQNADAALRQGMPVTVHVSEAATEKSTEQ